MKLRRQIMEMNDSNFSLRDQLSKRDSEKKAVADTKLIELESELKFKVSYSDALCCILYGIILT